MCYDLLSTIIDVMFIRRKVLLDHDYLVESFNEILSGFYLSMSLMEIHSNTISCIYFIKHF